jgi:hypothetical protein
MVRGAGVRSLLLAVVSVLVMVGCADRTRDLSGSDVDDGVGASLELSESVESVAERAGVGYPVDELDTLVSRHERESQVDAVMTDLVEIEWGTRTRAHCTSDEVLLDGRVIIGRAQQRWDGAVTDERLVEIMAVLDERGLEVLGRSLVHNEGMVPFAGDGWYGRLRVVPDHPDPADVPTEVAYAGPVEAQWELRALVAVDPDEREYEGYFSCP